MDSAVFLAVFAILSTMVVRLFKIIDAQNKAHSMLAESLKDNTSSQREIATETRELRLETKQGNIEAKERNGHLGQQNVTIAKLVTKQNSDVKEIKNTNKKMVELLKLGKDHHVKTQIVDTQVLANNKE